MSVGRKHRWLWIVLGGLALLVASGIVSFRLAVGALRDRGMQGLGPESEVAELRVGWSSVELMGLRIPAAAGWPARDALRAERITIVSSIRASVEGLSPCLGN